MSLTPFMGMDLPIPTVTYGPLWATQLNLSIGIVIDSHNHTSGKGAPVPSAGLNINGDLTFQNNNGYDFRSLRFYNQTSPIGSPSDLSCVYSAGAGGDLYFNDGVGNQIQITVGGALNAASIGGIGGDYATSTASVFYTNLNQTFTFWQSTGVNATLDVGDIIIRAEVAGAFGVYLTASASMSADYTLVLPVSLPSVQSFMTLDASGNIDAPWTVDNATIKIVSNQLTVSTPDLGIVVEHQFNANGKYRTGNIVDGLMFFEQDSLITTVWIYNLTPGSAGTTEFDLKLASPGGAFSSILSTTGKITSAAASNIWTDSGSIVAAQTGVTKPVLTTASVVAGQSIRFDILQTMTGASDCGVIVEYITG